MTSVAIRILTLILSVHLAMPPAWCCSLVVRVLPERSNRTKPTPHTCCQQRDAVDEDATKAIPSRGPAKFPCESACCKQHATLLTAKEIGPDLAAAMIIATVPPLQTPLGSEAVFSFAPNLPTLSFTILHCCWLC